ncbi:putative ACR protein [Halorhabdus tiamatea SARL4B]|uniref:Putative ACR protein n=1 Tax=Halorhabdus tiamatea SARL4B TaxID=1033806 RepID=F7PF92_9EURY|nr:DUF192 domain-containing protein [Halorhabdus tiamatea]ERJ05722.1 putative ACR protein [Halorhabdus tiamatea SARL4B]CCQ33955.1 conserved hypothetical protein (DUF192) [Halorhabdus tiamatea SARL4B]
MHRSQVLNLLAVALLVLAAVLALTGPTSPLAPLLSPLSYENATLSIHDENGTELGTVDVRVADTERERYVGLSNTESLAEGEGMLFVHPESGSYAYVMRNMAFPIDIVFAGENGTITTIHHAQLPENPDNPQQRYRGQGQYVLEVPYGWTNSTGIHPGDRVSIPDSVAN